jgi:ABC-type multidrug transport system fused ATPase/permease subunit
VIATIRQKLYSHIQRLSHSFHDTRQSGDLFTRLTGDINMMRDLLVNAAIYTSDRTLVVIGMIAIMLWMDWRLTLVALAILPLLGLTVQRSSEQIRGASHKQRQRESRLANVMTEKLSAISVVQAFAREAYEDELFSRRNKGSVRAGLRATKLEAKLNLRVQVILGLGTAAVLSIGVTHVQAAALTPGDLLVFTAYLAMLYKPIRRLAGLTSRVAKATVCAERIAAILATEPEIKDAKTAMLAPRFRGEIVFEDVAFGYTSKLPVLQRTHFRIAPGERVVVLGESGSGKTTIASLLLRFYDPTRGRVLIDGRDIREYTIASLRAQIAVVLQESVLFHTTIRDNIAYGKLDASQHEIEAAARAANIHDFILSLPDGYDALVGERGATLSGGQQQRLAIARATIQDAPIVILDEPLAGLDVANQAKVRAALERLTADRTCLTITHQLELATYADRVLQVVDGTVLEVDPKSTPGAALRFAAGRRAAGPLESSRLGARAAE